MVKSGAWFLKHTRYTVERSRPPRPLVLVRNSDVIALVRDQTGRAVARVQAFCLQPERQLGILAYPCPVPDALLG